jgi:hypothetical protein
MIWAGSLLQPEARLDRLEEPYRGARRSLAVGLREWYRYRYRKTWKCRASVAGGFSYETTAGRTRRTRMLGLEPAFVLNPPRTQDTAEAQPDGTFRQVPAARQDPRLRRIRAGSIYAGAETHLAYFTLKMRVENILYYTGLPSAAAENRPQWLPHATSPVYSVVEQNGIFFHFASVDVAMPAYFSMGFGTILPDRIGGIGGGGGDSFRSRDGSRVFPDVAFEGSPYACTWQGAEPSLYVRPPADRITTNLSVGGRRLTSETLINESDFYDYQFISTGFAAPLGRPYPVGTTETDLAVSVSWEEDQDRDL